MRAPKTCGPSPFFALIRAQTAGFLFFYMLEQEE
jgi:hypothetical protein